MFKGFNVKYPEYEVITPQTKKSYTVRSLNVQEEEQLKGSLVTPTKIHEHLDKCIYDSIVKKPDDVKDYETFLKSVTLKDRDALLYGLYHISYEEVRNYDVTCSDCGKDYSVTVDISSTFNFIEYPHDDILTRKIPLKLDDIQGVTCFVKQPTMFDELTAVKSLGIATDTRLELLTETLVIDSFQYTPESGNPEIYNSRDDIIDAYLQLPAKDKRKIHKVYREEFGKFGILLKMRSTCTFCGHEEIIDIDLVTNFFRMVYSF